MANSCHCFILFESTSSTTPRFCDMNSEPGFIWTLFQSFSVENTDIFRGKRFGINLPLNFDDRNSMSVESSSSGSGVEGTMYRMSLLQMQSLADHSTHLRATRNFPTHDLKITDYALQAEKSRLFRYIFVSVSSL